MKKILLFTLVVNLLSLQMIKAETSDSLCKAYAQQKISLAKVLKSIEDLRKLKIAAAEIESKVSDDENSREMTNLAEELETQARIESDAQVEGFVLSGVSLGSLVVASLIIKKTYNLDKKNDDFLKTLKDLKGWERFKALHVPLKKTFVPLSHDLLTANKRQKERCSNWFLWKLLVASSHLI